MATATTTLQAAQLRAKAKAMRSMATGYLSLKMVADDLAAKVDSIAARLLATECPLFDEQGQRITSNKDTYLADEAGCNAFYAAMDRELRAAAIKPADMEYDYCPALVARNAVMNARHVIIDTLAPLAGIDPKWLYGEKEKQFFDLAMGLILNA